MSHRPGDRVGPHEILAAIGAGGMGEVFKARDTRLDRTVAIKVFSADVTKSAAARQAFQREVRAAARLNHPNIVTAFDANEVGDRIFVSGNDAAGLGCVYGGATVAAWYPITPSTSVAEAFAKHCRKYRVDTQTGKNKR